MIAKLAMFGGGLLGLVVGVGVGGAIADFFVGGSSSVKQLDGELANPEFISAIRRGAVAGLRGDDINKVDFNS